MLVTLLVLLVATGLLYQKIKIASAVFQHCNKTCWPDKSSSPCAPVSHHLDLSALFGFLDKFILPYPSAVQPRVKAQIYQTRFCGTWYDEGAAWDESPAQVDTARAQHSLGKLPLVVITRGEQVDAAWQALQRDLSSLSSNSTQIIAVLSGHDIMFERPDLVIAAIKQVVT